MAVINTNYLALVSQNNLNKSQGALGQAIERLSSGLRINGAKDDAAGQAIANRFTANIKGLTQAARNANDGISLAQTTEGSLNEINSNLQRIRELTVDAANGTKSESDLKSIQDEINQRVSEINRVSEQTQFNGVQVLGGDAAKIQIQVGANDGETISINLREISADTLGIKALDVGKAYNGQIVSVGESVSMDADISGFTEGDFKVGSDTGTDGKIGGSLLQNDNGDYFIHYTDDADDGLNGYYEVNVAANGALTVGDQTTVDGTSLTETDRISVKVDYSSMTEPGVGTLAEGGKTELVRQGDNYYVKVTGATDPAGNGYYAATVDMSDGTVTVADFNQQAHPDEAPTGANLSPLAALDNAIAKVDSLRSELGAVQNRFESTIANLNNTVANLSESRSRIEDADYAVEVSNMTRAQILQQAGTSVLAQANQVPQTMLSLLG